MGLRFLDHSTLIIDVVGQARLWYTAAEASAGARLSYHLNLTGPNMEIKTACSSSAVAIHQGKHASNGWVSPING